MKRRLLLFCLLVTTLARAQQKPNIILIVADDLGWNDVGYHNPLIVSPNLNELARKGTELRRFYVASICSPTRSGLLTGKYPDRFGIRNEVIRPNRIGGLPLTEQTLANVLANAGYTRRGAFGKWHLGHSDKRYHPLQRGFTSFYGHYNGAIDYFTHFRNGALDWHRGYEVSRDTGYSVELVGKEAAKFIRGAGSREPFFAYVAFNGVHSPNQARKQDLLRNGYEPTGTRLEGRSGEGAEFNTADYGQRGRGNTLRQTFSAQVTGLDDAVGTILQAVEEAGIADNTLIWFLSDNGGTPTFGGNNEPLRGVKNTEWEGGVRSTSLVYWKGKIDGGRKVDEVLAFIDVLPTLAALTGAPAPAGLDGIDARAAWQGKVLPERILFLGREAAVSKRWKLNQGQFFDLQEDPSEKTNVSATFPSEYKTFTDALASFKKFVQPFSLPAQPNGWRPPENWAISEP